MEYKVITLEDRFDLFEAQDVICSEVWDEFMLHDPVADEYWMQFINAFKSFQIMIMDGDEFLAIANTVPIEFDKSLDHLPENGWDWAVEKSVKDFNNGIKPNLLIGLQIVVNKRHQGKGLSSIAVKEMATLARIKGFDQLVIPVRPSDKHKYPLIPIDDYILWKNDNDLPFDNWLRVHIKCGGKILKPCHKAMRIPGSIKDWIKWTGMKFPGNGQYVIPGALNPVTVNREKDEVLYIEPNVWVIHNTSK